MTIETLKSEMIKALKDGNKERRTVLSSMVAAVNDAAITPKGRIEITEELVNSVLLKQVKIVREQIDTCPASRPDILETYKSQLAIIEEFAPVQITDEAVIRKMITAACKIANTELSQNARKIVMPKLKDSGADMKIVNKVFTDMLKEI